MANAVRKAQACMTAALMLALSCSPGFAENAVTVGQLQATVRALGFLSNLPNSGTLNFAIVYVPDAPGAEARANQVALLLNPIPGPDRRTVRATAIGLKELTQSPLPFDAIFLMPGTASQGAAIREIIKRRHIVSISADPECLDANCCVLMIGAEERVRIVMDTNLASLVGARFSSVFSMIVSRK